MNLQAGILIKSTDALNDTLFAGAQIFITTYDKDGAIGFVVNKLFDRSLTDLEAFRHNTPFALFDGGPVDKEHLFFIHQRPDLIADGSFVGSNIYLGGNLEQAVAGINSGALTSNNIKIFIGYCGWDSGELEAEIKEGSWIIAPGAAEAVFSQ
jgi:putative transcriptional regulator